MATSDGVEIRVALPAEQQVKKRGAKAPATLQQSGIESAPGERDSRTAGSPDDAPACPCGWSSAGLWTLFVLGWVFPPCWWVGVAAGLKTGSDSQFLIKRRRNLSPAHNTAWWACVLMSVVSTLVLILVLAIYFGQKGPAQQGER